VEAGQCRRLVSSTARDNEMLDVAVMSEVTGSSTIGEAKPLHRSVAGHPGDEAPNPGGANAVRE
jgi:hypothetical protein